jgi:hypothetical protein
MNLRQLERILTVVDRTLRKEFPSDFHKRCAYAAIGTRRLLQAAGVDAELIGGDFLAFVVSQDGNRAGIQGFGGGEQQCSHFWVEAEGRLIDLGVYFLPSDSSYPVARMPAAAWDLNQKLPRYLRYREQERFDASTMLSPDPVIMARCDHFIAACDERMKGQTGPADFSTWLMTGAPSVAIAANRRDPWANAALKFNRDPSLADLPF